jgi:hypothetical protein
MFADESGTEYDGTGWKRAGRSREKAFIIRSGSGSRNVHFHYPFFI